MMDMTAPICEDGLNSPEMVDFMKSPLKFDLYIMERGLVPCFYGVAHAVGSPPVVGLVTLGAYHYIHWNDGNPDNPAYTPWWIHPYSDHLSFWQRHYSSYVWLYSNLVLSNVVLPKHETIQKNYFAHPNVKVFITQGGLQSFNEATYYGVPLIGIPFMGDQHYNGEKFVAAETGYRLQFRHVTKDTVLKAIRTVLEDPRYRENMKKLSAVYREHQAQSMPKAIWWIEYVLRHKGAPHLRSGAMDLSWYQLLLLDVVAFVLAVAATTTLALYSLARYLTSLILNAKKHKTE
ncbi:UDP-glycosyltransferase UGT5-like [Schistocerca serialis cubense]|uniref:UDP-glycosyltransferase UGT5-like n=1 Tax=Schistocerca serialis cubense TaxID=2023355 RepID=UPI00214EC45A|nr:UDP-glycosyltransferase UGT5-like [Schistocerca serialis cubense]